jgi:hypothetical protein
MGSLGLGESDRWWDCEEIDEMIARLLRAGLGDKIQPRKFLYLFLLAQLVNPQRRSKAYEVGEHHYDLGNDLFERMLDKRMTWRRESNLRMCPTICPANKPVLRCPPPQTSNRRDVTVPAPSCSASRSCAANSGSFRSWARTVL